MTRSNLMKVIIVTVLSFVTACSQHTNNQLNANIYQVHRTSNSSVTLDGKRTEQIWKTAPILKPSLSSPWSENDGQKTEFQAVFDGEHLYYLFRIKDQSPVAHPVITQELEIGNEDRVEIFFAVPNGQTDSVPCSLETYYGFETDYEGRTLDFSAQPYRRFNFEWKSQTHKAVSTRDAENITIEGKISISELMDLKLIDLRTRTILTGIFRGDFDSIDDQPVIWTTWVNPNTKAPDFHVCEAFGTLIFQE